MNKPVHSHFTQYAGIESYDEHAGLPSVDDWIAVISQVQINPAEFETDLQDERESQEEWETVKGTAEDDGTEVSRSHFLRGDLQSVADFLHLLYSAQWGQMALVTAWAKGVLFLDISLEGSNALVCDMMWNMENDHWGTDTPYNMFPCSFVYRLSEDEFAVQFASFPDRIDPVASQVRYTSPEPPGEEWILSTPEGENQENMRDE